VRHVTRLTLLMLFVAAGADAAVDDLFMRGETLDYNLSWSRIGAGSARMTISPAADERYRITSVGKSSRFFNRVFKVRDELESFVTRDTFTTVQYRKIIDERGRRKDELTTVNGTAGKATRKGKDIEVPTPVFDPLSLMYYIRRLDMSPGRIHEFIVLADGKVYTLQARIVSRQKMYTPAGTFDTVLVEPKMLRSDRNNENRLLIWYTDDERRIPVRIWSDVNVGSITATLRSVQPGVTSTEPPTVRDE
jgi:hypothetical protein